MGHRDGDRPTEGTDPIPPSTSPTATSSNAASAGSMPDQRTVIVLHYYLGLPLDEVADVLGIPPGTVRSRLHRATQPMRAALDADTRAANQNERRSA